MLSFNLELLAFKSGALCLFVMNAKDSPAKQSDWVLFLKKFVYYLWGLVVFENYPDIIDAWYEVVLRNVDDGLIILFLILQYLIIFDLKP